MTWKRAVADELARSYRIGQEFTLFDFYARAEARLQSLYPANTTVRDTMRQVMQRLRDEGLLEFLGNGRYVYRGASAAPPTRQARSPLAQAVWELAARVTDETKIAARDYVAIARAADPESRLRSHIDSGRASGTFLSLYQSGRLDLSLEQFVVKLGGSYALQPQVIVAAADRLAYYQGGEE